MKRLALALLLLGCGSDPEPTPTPDEPAEDEPAPLPPAVTPEQEAAHDDALESAEGADSVLPDALDAMEVGAAPRGEAPEAIVPQLGLYGPLWVFDEGRRALVRGDGRLGLLDVRTGRVRAWMPATTPASRATLDATGGRALARLYRPAEDDYSTDETVAVLWDLATGERARIAGASNAFFEAIFRPDGQRVLVVRGDAMPTADEYEEDAEAEEEPGVDVHLYDLDGALQSSVRLDGTTGGPPTYSRDGSRIAMRGEDEVLLLDAELARVGRVDGVWRDLAVHPEAGAWLLVNESEVRLTDLGGETLHSVAASEGARIRRALWTEDGERLFVIEAERVRVLHGRSLEPLWDFALDGAITAVSPDGERVVIARELDLTVCSGRTGRPVRAAFDLYDAVGDLDERDGVRWVGDDLLVAGSAGAVRVPIESGEVHRLGGALRAVPMHDATWFGSSRIAAHGSYEPMEPTLTLWQPSGVEASGCTRTLYPVDADFAHEEAWHERGPYLMRIEHVNSGTFSLCAHGVELEGDAESAHIVAGGRWLWWHEEDADRISDASHPQSRRRLPLADGERLVAISGDGRTLLGSQGDRLRVLRRTGGVEVCRFETEDVFQVELAPDGSSVHINPETEPSSVRSVADGSCARGFELDRPTDVRLLPRGRVLVVRDDEVEVRGGPDLAVTGRVPRSQYARVTPFDDRFALASGEDVSVWSLTNGASIARYAGFRQAVGSPFALRCEDGVATRLDLRTGERATGLACARSLSADGRLGLDSRGTALVLTRFSDGLEVELIALAQPDDAPLAALVVASDGRFERLRAPVDSAVRRAAGPLRTAALSGPSVTRGLLREVLTPSAESEHGEAE